MPFSSFRYLVFLPLVVAVQALVLRRGGARAGQALVLVASLVFYGWSQPSNLPILAGSILANWALARWMAATKDGGRKRRILVLGLALNIAVLCFFKYTTFFLGGLFSLGLPAFPLPTWGFPLGVSFFTLQQVMYLVDCYEGLVPPSGLFDHATFVALFAYVISGPLSRAKSMVRQLHAPGATGDARHDQIARGLHLFSMGLFKKVVFADSFGRVADLGYASVGDCSTLEAWAFSLAYTFQIYFDFSGYSDMAMGSALAVGLEIPRNFNVPFRSRTVIEFWQRWHISLSAFITTYLYTPILRSFKKATPRTASVATLAAMTIAGLWHGPSWTFVVYGAMHGAALVVNQYWKKTKRKLPAPVAWALTFSFVNLAFIVFRAPDLATAAALARRLVAGHDVLGTSVLHSVHAIGVVTVVPPLVCGAVAAFFGRSADDLAREMRPSLATSLGSAAMLLASCLFMNSTISRGFVYFAF
jgi:alginate O-acetyltransferase complex protein AlgI